MLLIQSRREKALAFVLGGPPVNLGLSWAESSAPAIAPGEACDSGAAPALSSSHISPQAVAEGRIEYAKGGTSVRVHLPTGKAVGGGHRGAISQFSEASRRRLLHLVNSIDQTKAAATAFIFTTLTYPKNFPSAKASKADLDSFIKAFERAYGPHPLIWKLEPQRRGAPHYHLLTLFGNTTPDELTKLITWAAETWHRIVGTDDRNHLAWHLGNLGNTPCIEKVRDWKGVSNYAGKYLGKTHKTEVDRETGEVLGGDWDHPGRYWGVRRKEDLPIEIITEDVTHQAAVHVRRWAIAWYERQPAQRFYIAGKKGRPGRTWGSKAILTLAGFDFPCSIADAVQSCADLFEVEVRAQPRRWGSSRGGCSMFMPASAFMRLIDLAKLSTSSPVGGAARPGAATDDPVQGARAIRLAYIRGKNISEYT